MPVLLADSLDLLDVLSMGGFDFLLRRGLFLFKGSSLDSLANHQSIVNISGQKYPRFHVEVDYSRELQFVEK